MLQRVKLCMPSGFMTQQCLDRIVEKALMLELPRDVVAIEIDHAVPGQPNRVEVVRDLGREPSFGVIGSIGVQLIIDEPPKKPYSEAKEKLLRKVKRKPGRPRKRK
jgi:hypothetical protein